MRALLFAALAGLAALALAACGAEEAPRLSAAGPRPARIQHRSPEAPRAGAELAVSGRQSFQGPSAFGCVQHARDGLQIGFRTDDPAMPVVAVRIERYRGSGPYRAGLFLTGRSRSGALVTSTGEVRVQVSQGAGSGEAAAAVLSGSFAGSYAGPAGKGSIEGRFDECRYAEVRDASGTASSVAAGP